MFTSLITHFLESDFSTHLFYFVLPTRVVLIIVLFYLTDRDADVEKLAEEEAESILVKLVMNVVQIVFQ